MLPYSMRPRKKWHSTPLTMMETMMENNSNLMTPEEIAKKEFSSVRKNGLNEDEVRAFLMEASQHYGALCEENLDLKKKLAVLAQAHEQLAQELEARPPADEDAAALIEGAEQEAEKVKAEADEILREAKIKLAEADAKLEEAKKSASQAESNPDVIAWETRVEALKAKYEEAKASGNRQLAALKTQAQKIINDANAKKAEGNAAKKLGDKLQEEAKTVLARAQEDAKLMMEKSRKTKADLETEIARRTAELESLKESIEKEKKSKAIDSKASEIAGELRKLADRLEPKTTTVRGERMALAVDPGIAPKPTTRPSVPAAPKLESPVSTEKDEDAMGDFKLPVFDLDADLGLQDDTFTMPDFGTQSDETAQKAEDKSRADSVIADSDSIEEDLKAVPKSKAARSAQKKANAIAAAKARAKLFP